MSNTVVRGLTSVVVIKKNCRIVEIEHKKDLLVQYSAYKKIKVSISNLNKHITIYNRPFLVLSL